MGSKFRPARGFTLIELVVVIIILGVLSSVAISKFIDISRSARLASVATLSATIRASADNLHSACLVRPDCASHLTDNAFYYTFDGQTAFLRSGWVNGGDSLNSSSIDTWVLYSGFTAAPLNNLQTQFSLDGAPDPVNCVVIYEDAEYHPLAPDITTRTTGC